MKKLYEIPIMQVMNASIEVIAESEEDAVEKFYEMDEDEMGYPFDNMYPSNQIDDSQKIKCLGFLGGAEEMTYE